MKQDQSQFERDAQPMEPGGTESDQESVIRDLANFHVSYFFQNEPIPPVLLNLVALIAVLAADKDHQTLLETGVDPVIEFQSKEGGHG